MTKIRVTSTMLATVARLEVEVGATVERDQALLTLEVMKMEIPVESPAAGRVGSLHVATGELVAEGQLLVTLET